MEHITSKNNPQIISASKLSDKKYRERSETFAFEGIKLFREALSAGAELKEIYVTETAYEKYQTELEKVDPILKIVTDAVYEKLSFEQAPQGVFCVASYFTPQKHTKDEFVLILDGVADPGNLGAVMRSADAFGVDAIYVGKGCADLYNPKTVRSCMGSLFRVEVRRSDDLTKEIEDLQKNGFRIYATTLDSRSEDIRKIDLSGKIGFVIGNEGHGVSREVSEASTGSVIIPMREGPESLNAAVASSVVMWEAARIRLK